jgi:MraZ protein
MLDELFQVDTLLDEKGRLILPARLRKKLTAQGITTLVLMNVPGMGLFGFTPEDWRAQVLSRIDGNDLLARHALTVAHGLIAGAHTVDVDGQGRVLIPPKLRAKAGLEKTIVLQALLGRIEIWDAERWARREAAAEAAVQDVDGLSGQGMGVSK